MIKNVPVLMVLLIYSFLSFTALTAKEISGTLSQGEVSSFIPLQGSAFSIVSDVTCGIYDGTYDVLIKNKSRVFYESRDETDNLYLIFNEPMGYGDKIEIKVHRGVFIFKMSKMEKLPEVIIDALKEQVPEQYEKMESLHKPRVSPPIKESVIPQPKPIVEKEVISVVKPKVVEPEVKEIELIKPRVPEFKEEKSESFLETLTRKIDELFSTKEPEDVVLKTSPPPPTFTEIEIEKEIVKPASVQSGISNLPKEINIKEAMVSKTVTTPNIPNKSEELAKLSKSDAPKTSLPDIKTSPTFSPILNQKNDTDMAKIGLLEKKSELESFQKSSFPKTTQMQTGKFKTEISTTPIQAPSFKESSGEFGVREIKKIDDVPVFKNEIVKVPQVTKVVPIVTTPKPREVNKPIIEEGETNDKIIITKTIAPKDEPRVIRRHVEPSEYKNPQTQAIADRMSDRVLGGGYGQEAKATFAVKAYSNKKSVSAWVEVFKAGTNQRVKTFYTGSGRTLKDIKLPAGVYVVKATYRTAASKQKKTLGKIRLKEGQSIKRSISFDDGSIVVTVKKSNKPFYAKVEVFKSGSKRRVAYDFTSRKNGEVEISLASGTYDIIIKDYADERRLSDIVIKGSQTQMLNVNF